MLSRKIPKLKLDLKSKGRSRYILLHKYLLPGIPVLSIFAFIGIISTTILLSSSLTDEAAYAEADISPLATPETIGDSTASITIGGAGKEEIVSAGRGSTIYRAHSISITGSNVRNYTLSIYGDSNLKYVGGGSSGGTGDGSNDVLTSAGGVMGKTMNDSTTYDNTWGYGYGDSTTSNDSLIYKAPTGNTIGTAETLASGTVASSANGVLSINNKKLVFAAKFGEDKPQGNYRANVNLALTITPRVLTTYNITYSGNGNTSGTVPAKQSIDLYDTTSYNGFTAAANTGNLTKTGYNFLGWSESSTAATATYTAGSSTVSLTSSKPEITLYAVWDAGNVFKLTYNLAGGSGNFTDFETTGSSTYYNYTIPSTVPTRSGYDFLGWGTAVGATTVAYLPGRTISLFANNPTTLYAVWKKTLIASSGFPTISTMQQMTSSICSSAVLGATKTLTDTRDNSTYTITKLDDNKCWMTQNLRIVNRTVTSTNSNVSSSYKIPASATWVRPSDSNNYKTTEGAYYNNNTTYGAYYSYYTVTAGTSAALAGGSSASYDICPLNWRLPTTAEYRAMLQVATGIDSTKTAVGAIGLAIIKGSPYNFVPAGYSTNGPLTNVGTSGSYWTNTVYDNTRTNSMDFTSGVSIIGSNKSSGLSVRCVAK